MDRNTMKSIVVSYAQERKLPDHLEKSWKSHTGHNPVVYLVGAYRMGWKRSLYLLLMVTGLVGLVAASSGDSTAGEGLATEMLMLVATLVGFATLTTSGFRGGKRNAEEFVDALCLLFGNMKDPFSYPDFEKGNCIAVADEKLLKLAWHNLEHKMGMGVFGHTFDAFKKLGLTKDGYQSYFDRAKMLALDRGLEVEV